jgi:hypothetical protein
MAKAFGQTFLKFEGARTPEQIRECHVEVEQHLAEQR